MTATTARPVASGPPSPEAATTDGVLRRIARQLAPYKKAMLLVAVVVLCSAALASVAPFLTKAVFDDALFPVDGGPVNLPLLWWLFAGLVAIPVVTALLGIGQNFLTSRIGNSAMADLRSDLFAHLQRMELAFFTGTKTGAIQSRLANDVAGVRTVLTDTATTILQNSVTVIAAFVAMVLLSWQLTDPDADLDAAVPGRAGAGGSPATADRAPDPGVAVGDDRDHRGVAVGVGHPAGQGLRSRARRDRALPRRRTATRPGCRSRPP